jgi:TRAP-type C4-dicarboxylate transport system substrate-binding protein
MKLIKTSLYVCAVAVVGFSATLFGLPNNGAAETKLTLVYPFPDFLQYTKNCKALVKEINSRGKGVVKIDILPFNSIKMFAQAPAVSKGRVDLNCIPAAFYARGVPELEAISTASSSVEQARNSGGIDMLDELQQKHFKVKYLGWTSDGNKFRFYMKNKPKFTSAGLVDFKGVKLRGNPIYGAFIEAMGGTQHNLPATATYGALEKGVVDAAAWATIGLRGLKWDKMLRHAVEPDFYSTDIGWIMNLNKWNGLSKKAQNILHSTVKEYEMSNRKSLLKLHKEEKAALIKGGMTFHNVPNSEKYLKLAVDSAYERMVSRLKKANRSTDHISKLRAAWQQ